MLRRVCSTLLAEGGDPPKAGGREPTGGGPQRGRAKPSGGPTHMRGGAPAQNRWFKTHTRLRVGHVGRLRPESERGAREPRRAAGGEKLRRLQCNCYTCYTPSGYGRFFQVFFTNTKNELTILRNALKKICYQTQCPS